MLADDLTNVASSQQIVEAILSAVRRGELAPGAPLPSVRQIAQAAGVSPGTAALAFRILRDRGTITTAHGRRATVSVHPTVQRSVDMSVPDGVHNLATVGPDPKLLPDVNRILSRGDIYEPILYDTENVEPSLAAVMTSQFADDSITGELTVTSGALDALERILQARLKPGDAVVVEDPTWGSALALLQLLGLTVVGAEVDDEGITPQALRAALASRHCAALFLTTRAQNPYGSAMTENRAAELARILESAPDLLIIEDDHAGPIAGAPAATLTAGRPQFAVVRSVNKTLGPDLRVAITCSDETTAHLVQGRQLLGPGWVSHFAQRTVAALLADPATSTTIARASVVYTERREALVAELAARGVTSHGRSGLNVLIEVPDETAVVSYLITHGWAVRGGSAFRLNSPPFIRVCTSTLLVEQAPDLADRIAEVVRPKRRFTSH